MPRPLSLLGVLSLLLALGGEALPGSGTGGRLGSYAEAMASPRDTFWTLDRVEDGRWAVLEAADGSSVRVPRVWLPRAVREGHVLRLELGSEDELGEDAHASELRFAVDEVETQQRMEATDELRDRLPEGPEGDLDL